MEKARYDTASKWHTFTTVLGITMLVFLVLINIAVATQFAPVQDSSSNSQNIRILDPGLKNSYEKQLKEQDEALRNDSFDSEAWKLKGWDLQNLNRLDEALIAYYQAIQVNPRDSDAWIIKGDFLLEPLNRPDEAIRAYDKAIELNPKGVWNIWYMKGAAYDELGKYNEAIDAYKKSIILDPYDSTNQATRDAIERDEIKLGRPEKEIKTNDKAIEINPLNSAVVHNKKLVPDMFKKQEDSRNEENVLDERKSKDMDTNVHSNVTQIEMQKDCKVTRIKPQISKFWYDKRNQEELLTYR